MPNIVFEAWWRARCAYAQQRAVPTLRRWRENHPEGAVGGAARL